MTSVDAFELRMAVEADRQIGLASQQVSMDVTALSEYQLANLMTRLSNERDRRTTLASG